MWLDVCVLDDLGGYICLCVSVSVCLCVCVCLDVWMCVCVYSSMCVCFREEGRLATPQMKIRPKQRTHHDRTTPATGTHTHTHTHIHTHTHTHTPHLDHAPDSASRADALLSDLLTCNFTLCREEMEVKYVNSQN